MIRKLNLHTTLTHSYELKGLKITLLKSSAYLLKKNFKHSKKKKKKNNLSPQWKRPQRAPFVPCALWGQSKKAVYEYKSGSKLSPGIKSARPWSWISQPPELGEINVCCFQTTQSMVSCYRSPNRLRYRPPPLLAGILIQFAHSWVFQTTSMF